MSLSVTEFIEKGGQNLRKTRALGFKILGRFSKPNDFAAVRARQLAAYLAFQT